MFILYELATGRAHSQSSQAIDNPNPDKWGVKETDKEGVWDNALLDFVPILVAKKLSKLAFLNRFTNEELVTILSVAKQNALVEVFVKKLDASEFVDLSYPPTIEGINALASAGLLTESRANEVLNG